LVSTLAHPSFFFFLADDDYLINRAQPARLLRLRKDQLARLYSLAGLSEDTANSTKSYLVDAIVDARDDIASLPPSSPRGEGSDYSSDEGVPAESDDGGSSPMTPIRSNGKSPSVGLRRRATTNDMDSHASRSRPNKNRSASMGNVLNSAGSSSKSKQGSKRSSR
jgi:mitogen-activated protein kinase kinase kinase 13